MVILVTVQQCRLLVLATCYCKSMLKYAAFIFKTTISLVFFDILTIHNLISYLNSFYLADAISYLLFTICVAIVRKACNVCKISGLIEYIFVLLQIQHHNQIPLFSIAALVFDTTAVNSGQYKGIVV